MSELEGENKVKDTNISFDSSKIEDNDKSELFTKIEGEEARKAAAERAAKSKHEKDIKEKAKEVEDSKKLDEKLKKAEKESKNYDGKKKNKFLEFFFGGWHKWVFVAVILIVLLLVIVAFYFLKDRRTAVERASEKVEAFKSSCESEKQENGFCFSSVGDLENYIENENDQDAKTELLKNYEEYVMSEFGDAGRVKAFLDRNIPEKLSDQNRQTLCDVYSNLYYESDNWEEYAKDCEL